MPMLAAAYAFGFVKNHPYRDGNKRIGFLAMVTFLGVNRHDFSATEAEVVTESWPSQMAVFQKKRSPNGFGVTVREVPVIRLLGAASSACGRSRLVLLCWT